MFIRIPSARSKADSGLQPIAPTPGPLIGNAIVGPGAFSLQLMIS